MRICFEALIHHEHAEAGDKRDFPAMAKPAPTPTMFACGDARQEKKRSGNPWQIRVHRGFRKIGVHSTTSRFSRPSSTKRPPEGLARGRAHLDFKFGFWAGMVSFELC